jgi:hypothetical protein
MGNPPSPAPFVMSRRLDSSDLRRPGQGAFPGKEQSEKCGPSDRSARPGAACL